MDTDTVARIIIVTLTEELRREISLVVSEYGDETNSQMLAEMVARIDELVESCAEAIDETVRGIV